MLCVCRWDDSIRCFMFSFFSLCLFICNATFISIFVFDLEKSTASTLFVFKKKKSNTQKHTNKIQIKCEKSARSRRMSVQAKELKQLRRWNKKWNLVVRKRKSVREKIFVDSENIISKLVVCYTYTCTYTNASVLKSGKSSNKTKT